MAHVRSRLLTLAAFLALPLLAGCPLAPQLGLSTYAISFGDAGNQRILLVTNTGGGTLTFTVQEVTRASEDAPWAVGEVPWLSANPTSGSVTTGTSQIALAVSRDDQNAGLYNNTGIQLTTNAGVQVVPVSMIVRPTLSVSPPQVTVQFTDTSGDFTVINSGAQTLSWEALFVPDPENLASARPIQNGDGITVTPNPATTAANGTTPVTVEFTAGRGDFTLLVASSGGDSTVRFHFGSALEGLEARPSPLTVYVDNTPVASGGTPPAQVASVLRIINVGTIARTWSLAIEPVDNPGATAPFTLSASTGTTAPTEESAVNVSVVAESAEDIETGAGRYQLRLSSGDGLLLIPVRVEAQILPVIALSRPPETSAQSRPEIQPITLLDFGGDEVQQTFYVANVGPRDAKLTFAVTHDDLGKEDPLVLDVTPLEGDTNGPEQIFFHPEFVNLLIDAQPIIVTIDRSALQEEVEFRTLTVTAIDPVTKEPIAPVEPATLQIRVERPPLVMEGTNNRSRGSHMMRFEFLLRDSLGQVIRTDSPAALDRIRFAIEENGVVLDPNEAGRNIKVSRPLSGYGEGDLFFKGNVMLMLDFTGSMYNAGVGIPGTLLDPGEAIQQVRDAALKFIDDLPPTYRVGLMYHSKRQQPNHVIAPLSDDREALKATLSGFVVPVTEMQQSDIYDALQIGVDLLAAETTLTTLPFDDPEVNALVFITDGRDNASVTTASAVATDAQEKRVRLFPLTYSAGSAQDTASLIVLAHDTGGHFYAGKQVQNLLTLLGNRQGLGLTESGTAPAGNTASFKIVNEGEAAFNWSVETDGPLPWLPATAGFGAAPSSGSLDPDTAGTNVTLTFDPTAIAPNTTVAGDLLVHSGAGEGRIHLVVSVGANNSLVQDVALTLTDEPGTLWHEFGNHILLTYNTPAQAKGDYLITASYQEDNGDTIAGSFQRDGVFVQGLDIAGQLSLHTRGIQHDVTASTAAEVDTADVYLYADFVPTGITQFRTRFYLTLPEDLPDTIEPAAETALRAIQIDVSLADDGLLGEHEEYPEWRLVSKPDNEFLMLTDQEHPLPFSSFGNLLKIRLSNLSAYLAAFNVPDSARQAEFTMHMRADNAIYVAPATPTRPSQTRYFMYPGALGAEEESLTVGLKPGIAQPADNPGLLLLGIPEPEATFAWNRDRDSLPDFDDPSPDVRSAPGTIVAPNPVDFPADGTPVELTVRNQRLSTFTFTWQYTATNLAANRVSINGSAPASLAPLTLKPGESVVVSLQADGSTLAEGTYRGTLLLQTDVFGTEQVPLSLSVVAP